ncbi:hypothetical protein BC834DRAFT_966055 [Gloeopeniophorella convolvens]|nr:hypothetical protein BC834DRAFT_966055 [Gloeopeniophorella convolvens]
MPVPAPPYPSFTLVMTTSPFAAYDNMRLPAYRGSHLGRYHPYPRSHPSHHEEHMTTVDYRFSDPPRPPVPCVTAKPSFATIVEDAESAGHESDASTMVVTDSLHKRRKVKIATERLRAIVTALRRVCGGISAKQEEEKLKFDLLN